MSVSRRDFLFSGLGMLGWSVLAPDMWMRVARAASLAPRQPGKSRVLVVVQLTGGNDGLNTVVPYGLGAYYQARPTLAVKESDVLPLTGAIGLNPNMKGLSELYARGKLAVVQAVGYAEPNRSHFRSIEIWQTAQPDKIGDSGWLGRYLELSGAARGENPLPAVNVDALLPKTLACSGVVVPSVNDVYDFRFKTDSRYAADRRAQVEAFRDIYSSFDLDRPHVALLRKVGLDANDASERLLKIVRAYRGVAAYPGNQFGKGLRFIAQMICGGLDASVYHIALDGFDTHANQQRVQPNLLKTLSAGLSALQADLEKHSVDSDVITLVFSEFGRRVAENGGRGTDHGTAAPVLVIGSPVKGGIYGDHASLTRLDDGDLRFKIDFRTVYATILDRWLRADSRQILGASYGQLPFI